MIWTFLKTNLIEEIAMSIFDNIKETVIDLGKEIVQEVSDEVKETALEVVSDVMEGAALSVIASADSIRDGLSDLTEEFDPDYAEAV